MNENRPIDPKEKFFDAFIVKADRMATEYVQYNPGYDFLSNTHYESWGDTVRVSIEATDFRRTEILSLKNRDEKELTDELAILFEECGFDQAEFTKRVQLRYQNENEVTNEGGQANEPIT